ncbi:UNVERIFIED_ASMBLY: hypothetical protein SD1_46 [Shigella phage 2019SD1]|uniref:Uncharacterized protein n=1 Tax=Shigella phage 2019SD1 TaxID=2848074 RepID=A0A6M5CAV5_9CAUD|nr:hypothetical protein H1N84_gp46 [Shigella phage 2019SD1]
MPNESPYSDILVTLSFFEMLFARDLVIYKGAFNCFVLI